METHDPPHPGIVLKELYLPEGMGVSEAAKKLAVSRQTLSAIINGRAGISADMVLQVAQATSPAVEWLITDERWQARSPALHVHERWQAGRLRYMAEP